MFKKTLSLKDLFAVSFIAIFCTISYMYIGLLWGSILGVLFTILCISLLFRSRDSFTFELSPKLENLVIAILLLATLVCIFFSSGTNKSVFFFWEDISDFKLLLTLIIAILYPFFVGYLTLSLLLPLKSSQNYSLLAPSFFVGTLITLISFLLTDAIGFSKNLGVLIVVFVMLLAKMIKEACAKQLYMEEKLAVRMQVRLYTIVMFVFAAAMYSSVYLNYSSFVKGDLWKQCAVSSYIQLNGLEKYLKAQVNENIFEYPSMFFYFLASMAETFSVPLINLAELFAIVIAGVSAVAMLCYFSAVEHEEHGRAKFAVLIWFLFSGWGMLYLLLEYGTLQPPSHLAVTLMNKLGWGSGLIYSPALGSFEHVLRLFSIAAMINSLTVCIQGGRSLRAMLLGFFISFIAILFHPLCAFLFFVFPWVTFILVKPEVAIYSGITFLFSYGIILFFDFFTFRLYFNDLAVLGVLIVAAATIILKIKWRMFKLKFLPHIKVPAKIRFLSNLALKGALLGSLSLYIYAFAVLHWNYKSLGLDRFPTIPLYAWPNILGLAGLLALALLGVIVFRRDSPTFGEKYFLIFALLVFFTSIALDYNNVYQVVKIFNPNIISFRLIPVITIPVSYLAGSLMYRIFLRTKSKTFHQRKYYTEKLLGLSLIILMLGSMFTFTLPRVKFWMENNWPSINAEEYNVSDEELALINYLRKHMSEDEFLAVKGGQASPLGRIVSLSGAKVISKELANVFFNSRSIETIAILRDTLNIEHIVEKKPLYNQERIGYIESILLKNALPSYETNRYVVYELSSLLKRTEAKSTPTLHDPFHYGIFAETVGFSGKIELETNLLYVRKLELDNLTLTNVKMAGDLKLTLISAEGNFVFPPTPSNFSLEFDGLDDYSIAPNILNSTSFTVQFWVKLNALQKSNIVDSRDKAFMNGGKGFSIEDSKGDGKYQVGIGDGSNFNWSRRIIDLSDLRWHNIAISANNTMMTIYVDGAIKGAVDISMIGSSISEAEIIKTGRGLAGYFKGQISILLIYDRACKIDEIRFNMLNDEPLKDGLILWFNFEEGSGNILHDKSYHQNNGVIYGGSWRLSGIEMRLFKPAILKITGISNIFSEGTKNITKTSIMGRVISSLVLVNKQLQIRVNGCMLMGNASLTWPYIEKIGSQGDISLSDNLTFEILNTHDVYIPIRIASFKGLESHYQDFNRERIIKYTQRHTKINLLPEILQLGDVYVILVIFSTILLAYFLLVKSVAIKVTKKHN